MKLLHLCRSLRLVVACAVCAALVGLSTACALSHEAAGRTAWLLWLSSVLHLVVSFLPVAAALLCSDGDKLLRRMHLVALFNIVVCAVALMPSPLLPTAPFLVTAAAILAGCAAVVALFVHEVCCVPCPSLMLLALLPNGELGLWERASRFWRLLEAPVRLRATLKDQAPQQAAHAMAFSATVQLRLLLIAGLTVASWVALVQELHGNASVPFLAYAAVLLAVLSQSWALAWAWRPAMRANTYVMCGFQAPFAEVMRAADWRVLESRALLFACVTLLAYVSEPRGAVWYAWFACAVFDYVVLLALCIPLRISYNDHCVRQGAAAQQAHRGAHDGAQGNARGGNAAAADVEPFVPVAVVVDDGRPGGRRVAH